MNANTWITADADACLLRVKVMPRASRPSIQGIIDDRLIVRLQSPPIDGRANAELIKLLSDALGIAKSMIEIVRGESSRLKRVRIRGVDSTRVEALARGHGKRIGRMSRKRQP